MAQILMGHNSSLHILNNFVLTFGKVTEGYETLDEFEKMPDDFLKTNL